MAEIYALAAHLDSAAAPGLCTELLSRRGKDLVVEGEAVTHAGALGLQVLVAAQRQWIADGADFQLINASAPLMASCAALGIPTNTIGIQPAGVPSMEAAQ